MKTINKLLFNTVIIIAGCLVMSSCKTEKPDADCDIQPSTTLKVTVNPVFGGESLQLDSTYTTAEGYDIQFINLKFFAENIQSNGLLKDAALYDYRETGTELFRVDGTPDDVTSISANLGVGADVNHSDPSGFASSSALNILNSGGMHWGWNPGYIFVKVEAKVDTIPDGNPLFDQFVIFHVGKDENLQTLEFNSINWQTESDGNYVFPLKLDMKAFLENASQPIDVATENTSHTSPGQEALSLKVIENFKAAISEF